MFTIINFLFVCTAMFIEFGVLFYLKTYFLNVVTTAYALVTFIPSLAVTVRRLHDVGKSGWMYLIIMVPLIGPFWFLYLLCKKGEEGRNKWGPDPRLRDPYFESIEEIGRSPEI